MEDVMKQFIYMFLLIILGTFLILMGCQEESQRKIRLSSVENANQENTNTTSTVLKVLPESQRSVAILLFRNETGDPELDWLQRGLTDMLTTDLQQSPYLNIISYNRLVEVAEQIGEKPVNWQNLEYVEKIAKKAMAEILILGKYYKSDNELLIDVELIDFQAAKKIPLNTVSGASLERIFAMVDELSTNVRENLRDDFRELPRRDLKLANMTNSVEAFKCYSKAIENFEKMLVFDAVKCFEDAIKYDSTFAAAYLRLAMMKYEGISRDEAYIALKKAEKYSDKLSELDRIRLDLTKATLEGRQFDLQNILEEAVRLHPSDIEFRKELARYYRYYVKDIDRALEEFEIIAEIDPNQKLTYNDLGYIYALRGDFTTAFRYFEKYRELAPDEANPYDSMGEVLIEAGRFDEAKKQLEIALQKWPEFYHSALRLSAIYTELGDFKNAVKYLNQVLSKAPSPNIEQLLKMQKAAIYWRFGKLEEAKKLLDSAIEKSTTNTDLLRFTGEFYNALGNQTKTRKISQLGFQKLYWEIYNNPNDYKSIDNFLYYTISAPDIDPGNVISMIKKLPFIDSRNNLNIFKKFALTVQLFRAGQYESAGKILTENTDKFTELLARHADKGWGSTWKYIIEIMSSEDNGSKSFEKFYHKMLEVAEKSRIKNFETMSRFVRTFHLQKLKDTNSLEREYSKLGTPLENTWWVIGPFSTENISGFFHVYPPEQKIDLNANYQSRKLNLKWKPSSDQNRDGYLNLRSMISPSNWAVSYALIYVYSPEKRKAQIRLGTDEACKLWLNDDQIWQHYFKEAASLDRDVITVMLHPGYNKILVKVTNTVFDWGYYFRVTDEAGNGFSDITFHSPMDISNILAKK